jgi:hypothetical protein
MALRRSAVRTRYSPYSLFRVGFYSWEIALVGFDFFRYRFYGLLILVASGFALCIASVFCRETFGLLPFDFGTRNVAGRI